MGDKRKGDISDSKYAPSGAYPQQRYISTTEMHIHNRDAYPQSWHKTTMIDNHNKQKNHEIKQQIIPK
jgi:hypothetical protein